MRESATLPFPNRAEAGRFLASKLAHYSEAPCVLVLGLPRGGVPVAYEVALALDAPLDVFVVRKLGVPGHEELAMGAIATGNVRVLNEDVIRELGVSPQVIEAVAAREAGELERRDRLYRGSAAPPQVQDHTVILVDDGLATGSTMRAAAHALRQLGAGKLVIAVPTAADQTCNDLRSEVDEIVCATTPERFRAVGAWYEDFSQTSDEEVTALLKRAASRRIRQDKKLIQC